MVLQPADELYGPLSEPLDDLMDGKVGRGNEPDVNYMFLFALDLICGGRRCRGSPVAAIEVVGLLADPSTRILPDL